MSDSYGERIREFRCLRCGRCCTWPGIVKIDDAEIDAIAAYLQMPLKEFLDTRTRLSPDRTTLSLTEKEDGSCFFYDPEAGCRINPVKPHQCRAFPYEWRFDGWDGICEGGKAMKKKFENS